VLDTRLTRLLGITHPVMLAGMGGVAYAELSAAVTEAGGFGCLGASTMSEEQLVSEMAELRDRGATPFGVDLLTAFPDSLARSVDLLIEGGARLLVAGLGVPSAAIERCQSAGVLVGSICGTVEHARRALAAGCDLIIAQGTEAGGHTGRVASMPLIPLVVDAVAGQVPVVAAGGIFDGRGLAAALVLGADGVWIGTRFIATPEARAVRGFKEALLSGNETSTTVSRAFSGKTMRVIANETTRFYDEHPGELARFPEQLGRSLRDGSFHLGGDDSTPGVDPAREGYPAGQALGAVDELRPAGELVRRIAVEAEEALQHGAQLRR
jgi:enoyl-[acyl-carrier protein] reductase II